jgi:hypothetical protein
MIGEHRKNALPFTAASDIVPLRPVKLVTDANRSVVLAASNNDEIQGFIGDATALRAEAVTVFGEDAVITAVAAASVGAGANVGVASTNGALGPVVGASGISRFRAGKSIESAAAGEQFSVQVKVSQLSNLI